MVQECTLDIEIAKVVSGLEWVSKDLKRVFDATEIDEQVRQDILARLLQRIAILTRIQKAAGAGKNGKKILSFSALLMKRTKNQLWQFEKKLELFLHPAAVFSKTWKKI